MNNKSLILLIISIIIVAVPSHAAGGEAAQSKFSVDCSESALLELRDPFAVQLPPKPVPTAVVATHTGTPSVDKNVPALSVGTASKSGGGNAGNPKQELPPVPSGPRLELTGIIFDTAKPKAIINGNVLGVGDRISGAVVNSISKGMVEIKHAGGIMKLRME